MAIKETKDLNSLSLEEINSLTIVYDNLYPIIENVLNKNSTFDKIIQWTKKINTKNVNVLTDNIIGKQFLMNQNEQDELLKILDLNTKQIMDIFKNCPRLNKVEGLKDQFCFIAPLLLACSYYLKKNQDKKAKFIYKLTFYKPYASRISRYFPYGVNEDRMRYTVEFEMNDRFDIRKYGSLSAVLDKNTEMSLGNYEEQLKQHPTDNELYIIFSSGIYSRINSFIKLIVDKYTKAEGKYLSFEASTFDGTGDSEGKKIAREAESQSTVKNSIYRAAINKLNVTPIETKLIHLACVKYLGSGSSTMMDKLHSVIAQILDICAEDVPILFDAMLSSFVFAVNPKTGEKYNASDLKTPVFLASIMNIYKFSNVKDVNILTIKKTIINMLEKTDYYNQLQATRQGTMKNALLFYFALFIQNAYKG